jgi:hypothetical protein
MYARPGSFAHLRTSKELYPMLVLVLCMFLVCSLGLAFRLMGGHPLPLLAAVLIYGAMMVGMLVMMIMGSLTAATTCSFSLGAVVGGAAWFAITYLLGRAEMYNLTPIGSLYLFLDGLPFVAVAGGLLSWLILRLFVPALRRAAPTPLPLEELPPLPVVRLAE